MRSKIIGKSKEQVQEYLGDNFTTDFGGDMWIYTFPKTWFRRERFLIIEFDYNEIAINVDKG